MHKYNIDHWYKFFKRWCNNENLKEKERALSCIFQKAFLEQKQYN